MLLAVVVFPAGAASADAAVLEQIDPMAEDGTARVLLEEPWGDGELVLVRYENEGQRRLGLGFAIEAFRGWRVAAYTEEDADTDDVAVGSLLVASSAGGEGQPPWAAALGELSDARISEVQIEWTDGESSSAPVRDEAYLVVREGSPQPETARFLTDDGTEIAAVPI